MRVKNEYVSISVTKAISERLKQDRADLKDKAEDFLGTRCKVGISDVIWFYIHMNKNLKNREAMVEEILRERETNGNFR